MVAFMHRVTGQTWLAVKTAAKTWYAKFAALVDLDLD